MDLRPSHLGVCVSDLDRSLRFWCEGLGFSPAERYDLSTDQLPGLAAAMEVPAPFALVSQMVVLGDLRVELIHYPGGGAAGTPSSSRAELGLTHLSFRVDDVDAAAAHLVAHGGTLLPATRTDLGIPIVFLADPDGTRIELMGG